MLTQPVLANIRAPNAVRRLQKLSSANLRLLIVDSPKAPAGRCSDPLLCILRPNRRIATSFPHSEPSVASLTRRCNATLVDRKQSPATALRTETVESENEVGLTKRDTSVKKPASFRYVFSPSIEIRISPWLLGVRS